MIQPNTPTLRPAAARRRVVALLVALLLVALAVVGASRLRARPIAAGDGSFALVAAGWVSPYDAEAVGQPIAMAQAGEEGAWVGVVPADSPRGREAEGLTRATARWRGLRYLRADDAAGTTAELVQVPDRGLRLSARNGEHALFASYSTKNLAADELGVAEQRLLRLAASVRLIDGSRPFRALRGLAAGPWTNEPAPTDPRRVELDAGWLVLPARVVPSADAEWFGMPEPITRTDGIAATYLTYRPDGPTGHELSLHASWAREDWSPPGDLKAVERRFDVRDVASTTIAAPGLPTGWTMEHKAVPSLTTEDVAQVWLVRHPGGALLIRLPPGGDEPHSAAELAALEGTVAQLAVALLRTTPPAREG
ncbi:MAG TPA: hypothetical protein DCZ72_15390 [Armatimonadetes bacterium]|nr:hypothetical protein [Armatimonadota bacterium]